jgi:hypothetical protein
MKYERFTSASRTLLVLGFVFSVCVSSTASAARPNVVIVMTDDQGYPEVSAHGNPVLQTPNRDALHSKDPNEWKNLVSLSQYKSTIEKLKMHLPERNKR